MKVLVKKEGELNVGGGSFGEKPRGGREGPKGVYRCSREGKKRGACFN